MNTKPSDLEFGLRSAFPEGAVAGWGARAIIAAHGRRYERFDVVPDRQDLFAMNEASRRALQRTLSGKEGALERAQARYRELIASGELRPSKAGLHVLFDEDGLKIVGNTNASCGYLYLAAYFVPGDVEDAAKAVCADDEGYQAAVDDDAQPKWSGAGPVPALGAEIEVDKAMGGGSAVVTGYQNCYGYVLACCVGERSDGQFGPYGAFGCDLAEG